MLDSIENQYLQIGHIARSHGVRGEVLIISDVSSPQLFDDIDLAHIQNARGDLIPARIESVRVQQNNDRLSFFVKFEHVENRNQAEALKSFPVYLLREKMKNFDEKTEAYPDYTSYTVIDEDGEPVGAVENVIENPAHPILNVITTGEQQLLIPFVDEYVISCDEEQHIIKCQNLDQLFDLL